MMDELDQMIRRVTALLSERGVRPFRYKSPMSRSCYFRLKSKQKRALVLHHLRVSDHALAGFRGEQIIVCDNPGENNRRFVAWSALLEEKPRLS